MHIYFSNSKLLQKAVLRPFFFGFHLCLEGVWTFSFLRALWNRLLREARSFLLLQDILSSLLPFHSCSSLSHSEEENVHHKSYSGFSEPYMPTTDVKTSQTPKYQFWWVWALFMWKEVIVKMSCLNLQQALFSPLNLCKLYALQKLILNHVSKAIYSAMIYNWLGSYIPVYFKRNKQILTAAIKRHKLLSKEQ